MIRVCILETSLRWEQKTDWQDRREGAKLGGNGECKREKMRTLTGVDLAGRRGRHEFEDQLSIKSPGLEG